MKEISKNQRAVDVERGRRRESVKIKGVSGLRLELYETGKRTWSLRYQIGRGRANRKMSTVAIGDADDVSLADAITKAREIVAASQLHGRDEAAERRRNESSETVDAVFDEWLERHAKSRTRTWPEEVRRWRADVSPVIGKVPAQQITRAHISRLRDDITARAPTLGNRILTLINRVFNWAVDAGLMPTNPAIRMRKTGEERMTRAGRYLSPAQIVELLSHSLMSKHAPRRRDIIALLAYTGQRRQEVAHMRRSELSDRGDMILWTIPEARRDAKKGGEHVVPLVGTAATIVRNRLAVHTGEFVFGVGGTAPSLKQISRIVCGLSRELWGLDHGPHDLRRSLSTGLAALGVSSEVRQRVLGHTPQTIEGAHYNRHSYAQEKAEALRLWAQHLDGLMCARCGARADGIAGTSELDL